MSDVVLVALVGAIPTTLAALGALAVSWKNIVKVGSLEIKVDGRLTQLLERTTEAALAVGTLAGVAQEKQDQAAIEEAQ